MAELSAQRSLSLLAAAQTAWAQRSQTALRPPGYVAALSDNLFLRHLHSDTETEFREGDGSELMDVGRRPAKMRALLSSSALAVNFFDAWRDTSKNGLAEALGLPEPITRLRFEYKCLRYPVGPRSPNLDLVLTLADGRRVGVESKFAEPYRRPGGDALLSPKYFDSPTGLWTHAGLSRAQELANELRARWEFLDSAQLLKHLLGLASETGRADTILLYLWFDAATEESARHRDEATRFADSVAGDRVAFQAVSYQDLFRRLQQRSVEPQAGLSEYLLGRYFAA